MFTHLTTRCPTPRRPCCYQAIFSNKTVVSLQWNEIVFLSSYEISRLKISPNYFIFSWFGLLQGYSSDGSGSDLSHCSLLCIFFTIAHELLWWCWPKPLLDFSILWPNAIDTSSHVLISGCSLQSRPMATLWRRNSRKKTLRNSKPYHNVATSKARSVTAIVWQRSSRKSKWRNSKPNQNVTTSWAQQKEQVA